jgi:mRNA interferase MazF
MNASVIEKKIELKKIIREARGYDTTNRFLDICSLNPIEFIKNLDEKTDYLSVTKVHIDKIANNSCSDVNQENIKRRLYRLFDYSETLEIYRSNFYWVDLGTGVGSEQASHRPALIVQNPKGNKFAPTVTLLPITSIIKGKHLPVHVLVDECVSELPKDSVILAEQIRTVDKKRVKDYIGECPHYIMKMVENALKIQLDLYNPLDVPDFVDEFVDDYKLSNKHRYALAKHTQKYMIEHNIDIKDNVDNYIADTKYNLIQEKINNAQVVIPSYA